MTVAKVIMHSDGVVDPVRRARRANEGSEGEGMQPGRADARASNRSIHAPQPEASSHAARCSLALVACLATLAAGLLGAPTASAATPEAPELTVSQPVHASEATFLGVLSPTATEDRKS